jgi:hypothetical protein
VHQRILTNAAVNQTDIGFVHINFHIRHIMPSNPASINIKDAVGADRLAQVRSVSPIPCYLFPY